MSSVLYSLGRWAYRARRLVLIVWIAALALLFAGAGLIGTGTDNTYAIPGTESQDALDALARTFPQVAGTSAQMIVVAPKGQSVRDPDIEDPTKASIASIAKIPQVSGASSPYDQNPTDNINPDSSSVLVPIQLSVGQTSVTPSTSDALQKAGSDLEKQLPSGSQVSVGGQLYSQDAAGISVTELIGIGIAFVVLAFTFVSLVAAGLPLVTALMGVGASLAIILTATRFITITSTTPLLALMLGLAVGIDYALFVVSRHQDQLKQGIPPDESAARAIATAGSAVVFAAITVIIALLGLSVANIPFLTTMGVAAALAVAMAVLISLTLTPALLGFAKWRVVSRAYRPGGKRAAVVLADDAPDAAQDVADSEASEASDEAAVAADMSAADEAEAIEEESPGLDEAASPAAAGAPPPPKPGFFLGWVRVVTRLPIVTVVVIVILLALATIPAAGLRLALPDAGSLEPHAPGRVTYDLIAKEFGPGFNGPLLVTGQIIQSNDPVGLMDKLGKEIAAVPGVAAVPLSTPNQAGDTGIVQVIPQGGPDSEKTKSLVLGLRALEPHFQKEYGVKTSVTGYTAAGIDISSRLADALLPFALLVVGLSLVLLAMVFRSIVVPVTAALGYLLSVGAAFGISSLVFEDGFLAGPLGVQSLGSVISFMPIILMGVLFGLAMDYEVFLVSRMREDYVHFGDARHAILTGFVGSAKVVTAAAIIMFSVFAAFVPSGDSSIQPIALGLAVGVAIDAFVVRMALIPAVLMLFGRRAWWFPAWLDRALPSFDVEGEGIHKELELAEWPEPGDRIAIAAEDLTIMDGTRVTVGGFEASVPAGDALVVTGEGGSGRTALLLALCGRVPVADGRVKVLGLALPMRAATVRSRTSIVRLASSMDPVADVRTALAGETRMLVLDDLDALFHPETRAEIAELLLDARHAAQLRDAPLTIVASCGDPSATRHILPEGMVIHMKTLESVPADAVAVS